MEGFFRTRARLLPQWFAAGVKRRGDSPRAGLGEEENEG